jgi:uncharacterized damage-inducible protein DinB
MVSVERLLAYDAWANGEELRSLEAMGAPPEKGVRAMGHLLATEAGWLDRMGQPAGFAEFWPASDLARLRAAWRDELPAAWRSFLGNRALSEPSRAVTYVNSRGERFTSAVEDVLMHVFLHSAYHRGQVASHVRASGGTPATTDFVHATRTGIVR